VCKKYHLVNFFAQITLTHYTHNIKKVRRFSTFIYINAVPYLSVGHSPANVPPPPKPSQSQFEEWLISRRRPKKSVSFDPILAVIALVCVVGAVLITRIVRKTDDFETRILRKRLKVAEDYIAELESDNKSLTNTLNRMQVGPKVEGSLSDIKSLLPELLPIIGGSLPKWAQSIMSVPGVIDSISLFVEKNPDKAAQLFQKFIKSGNGKINNGTAASFSSQTAL
jgi:type II secretory pathway pseudopilin PulG